MTKTNTATATAARAAKAAKAPANPDAIVQSSGMRGNGDLHFVKSAGGESLTFPTAQWTGKVRDAAAPGQSYTALAKLLAKQPAQLARGVKAGQAPHSAKALSDAAAKAKAPAATKADAVQAKAKAKTDAKAARAAKAEAKASERQSWKTDRPYKVLVKLDDIALRDGTWTKVMVEIALSHKDTATASAALAKHREFGSRKIDWKWLADVRKYVQF